MSIPKLTEETIEGYDNFKTKIKQLEDDLKDKDDRLMVLFTGNHDEGSSMSWCPDCVDFERILETLKKEHSDLEGHLLRVMVGARDYWKSPNNPFRTDPKLAIKSIPTIILWNIQGRAPGPQRLSDADMTLQNLLLFFED